MPNKRDCQRYRRQQYCNQPLFRLPRVLPRLYVVKGKDVRYPVGPKQRETDKGSIRTGRQLEYQFLKARGIITSDGPNSKGVLLRRRDVSLGITYVKARVCSLHTVQDYMT